MDNRLRISEKITLKKLQFLSGNFGCVLSIRSANGQNLVRASYLVFIIGTSWFVLFCFFEEGCFYGFFKSEYKSMAVLFGTIFSALRYLYSDKWKYCANLYNKINKLDLNIKNKKDIDLIKNKKDIDLIKNTDFIKNTLAIDILHLDMWSNRSFNDFLKSELTKSIQELTKSIQELDKSEYAELLKGAELLKEEKPCIDKDVAEGILYENHNRLAKMKA